MLGRRRKNSEVVKHFLCALQLGPGTYSKEHYDMRPKFSHIDNLGLCVLILGSLLHSCFEGLALQHLNLSRHRPVVVFLKFPLPHRCINKSITHCVPSPLTSVQGDSWMSRVWLSWKPAAVPAKVSRSIGSFCESSCRSAVDATHYIWILSVPQTRASHSFPWSQLPQERQMVLTPTAAGNKYMLKYTGWMRHV